MALLRLFVQLHLASPYYFRHMWIETHTYLLLSFHVQTQRSHGTPAILLTSFAFDNLELQ